MGIIKKILKGVIITEVAAIIGGAVTCFAAKKINNKTPEGGINETGFVDINGTKQWMNIYGQDINAPVLLYLHGGPFSATSVIDWTCMRKLSKDYIVVNWDQRGCGHNYPDYKETSAPTSETMMQDGREMTDYLCKRFGKEKITLMGFSWGSVFGSNLVLEEPGKYDAMIALSLVVDLEESQTLFKEYMLEKTENDPELHTVAENIDASVYNNEQYKELMPLITKYGYIDNVFKDADINFYTTFLFNPYCKLHESIRMYLGSKDYNEYSNNILCPDMASIIEPLELSGRTEYKVPFYLVEGKEDHGNSTMAEEATAYFEKITAPDKDSLYLEGGHNAPLMKTEQLAEFVHKIAEKNKK